MMTQSSELPDHQIRPAINRAGRSPRSAVTRVDLVEAVYRKVGLSRSESARLVELVFQEITDCLERGETVKLSSFGSFVVRSKGQHGPKPEDRGRGANRTPQGDGVQAVSDSQGEAPPDGQRRIPLIAIRSPPKSPNPAKQLLDCCAAKVC